MRIDDLMRMVGAAAIAALVTAFNYQDDITRVRIENNRLRARIEALKPVLNNLPIECGHEFVYG